MYQNDIKWYVRYTKGMLPPAVRDCLKSSRVGRVFYNKKFFHYTWIGVLISTLNIFLLWLLIDVWDVNTVLAGTIVVGATFIIRYLLYILFNTL